jgi:tRNA (cytidine/uridine-2'-O-)-methyltransferase
MRLALFQPDIPQNLGALLRLAACMGAPLEIIEPCAFPLSDRALRRTAMDYGAQAEVIRRTGWTEFETEARSAGRRIILFTTKGAEPYHRFAYRPGDTLLFGRESAGVPHEVHMAADARLIVPIRPETRSLNVVTTAAMALGEALRQSGCFPD